MELNTLACGPRIYQREKALCIWTIKSTMDTSKKVSKMAMELAKEKVTKESFVTRVTGRTI